MKQRYSKLQNCILPFLSAPECIEIKSKLNNRTLTIKERIEYLKELRSQVIDSRLCEFLCRDVIPFKVFADDSAYDNKVENKLILMLKNLAKEVY